MSNNFDGIVLFSSHSWKYREDRTKFHGLLQKHWIKGVDFIDQSVPSAHPIHDAPTHRALALRLRERIRRSDALVVFAGMYADRYWIEFEINMAFALGKPIIPIAPLGQERHSTVATDLASCGVVRWNSASICEAILAHVDSVKSAKLRSTIAMREVARLALSNFAKVRSTDPPVSALANALAPSLEWAQPFRLPKGYKPPR